MATFVEDLFGKSNRRRCVKGRTSYIEPSDNLLPSEDKPVDESFNNSEDYSGYDNANNVEVDDADEEAVTIDLSDFLNLNPLLPETFNENAADSGVLSDCHSQFRVTSSVTEASQIVVEDSIKSDTILNDNVAADGIHADTTSIIEPNPVISENGVDVPVENSSSEVNAEHVSWKENIVNGAQHSPEKLLKTKFKGRSNPLKSFKSISKMKAFNKNNVKVFGKYPVVQCEKLDIDNFVKKSKIKVGNWPLLPVNNRKPKLHTIKNVTNKKADPLIVQHNPKPFSRPISFNKFCSTRPNGTLDRARSILVESLEGKSDLSRGGMGKFQPPIIKNFNKSSKFGGGETLIKLMPQNISDSQFNDKINNQRQKFPIITSVNKMVGSPKTYHLISPKTNASPALEKNKSNSVTPILPKPVVDTTISPVLLKDFTVIQPYIEDPTSPIKPKPIFTVPLDIVPTIETVNSHAVVNTATSSPLRPAQPVFLNGAIQQISIPKKSGNKPVTSKTIKVDKNLNKVTEKIIKSPVTATSVVVDAMQSVFDKLPTKKPKAKQFANKTNFLTPAPGFSGLGCNAYNSTLNDMIFGFDAFDAESFDIPVDSESCDLNITSTIPDTHSANPICKASSEDDLKSSDKSIKCKVKRRRKTVHSGHDSDTWSASEGEDPTQIQMSSTAKRRQRKASNTSVNRKERRSSSSHLKSTPIFSLDSDFTDKILSNTTKKKSPQKLKEDHNQCSVDSSLFSEKNTENLMHIPDNSNSGTLLSPDHEIKDLGGSSTNLNLPSSEIKSGVKEILHTSKDRTKLKKELNQNSSSDLPLKLSTKSTKQKSALPFVKGKRIRFQTRFMGKSIVKKALSRPADIIKEINTITGANFPVNKTKKRKAFSAKEIDSSNPAQLDSENKTKTDSSKQKKSLRAKSKKKNKTLQVLFKRPTRKPNTRSLSAQDDTSNLSDSGNGTSSMLENNSDSVTNDEKLNVPYVEDGKKECEIDSSSSELKPTKAVEIQDEQATLNENASTDNMVDNQTTTSENSKGLCESSEISENTKLNTNLESDLSSASLSTERVNTDTPSNETNLADVPESDPDANDLSSQTDVISSEDKNDSAVCSKTCLSSKSLLLTEKSIPETSHDSGSKEISESICEVNSEDFMDTSFSNENLSSKSKVESATDHVLRSKRSSRNNRNLKSGVEDENASINNVIATAIEPLHTSESDEVKKVGRPRKNSSVAESNITPETSDTSGASETKKHTAIEPLHTSESDEVKKVGRPRKNSSVAESNITPETSDTSGASESKKRGRPRKSIASDLLCEVDNGNSTVSKYSLSTSDSVTAPECNTALEPCENKKRGRPKKNLKTDTVNEFNSLNSSTSKDSMLTSETDAVETVQTSEACEGEKLDNVSSVTESVCSSALKVDAASETIHDLEPGDSEKSERPKRSLKYNKLTDMNRVVSVNTNVPIENSLVTEINVTLGAAVADKSKKLGRPKKNSKGNSTKETNGNCASDRTENDSFSPLKIKATETVPIADKRSCRNKKNIKSNSISEIASDSKVSNSQVSLPLEDNVPSENSSILKEEEAEKNKKKCPKVKISVAKPVRGSKRRSLKNWYISERKASTESIPSDEITVLKPSERAELNKIKESPSKQPNRPLSVEAPDNERNNESRTFVINAIVHVDAIPDDPVTPALGADKIIFVADGSENTDHLMMNKTIILDVLDSMINAIELNAKDKTSNTSKECAAQVVIGAVQPIPKKQGPIDPDEIATISVDLTAHEKYKDSSSSKPSGKRKSIPATKVLERYAAAVKRASTPKIKGTNKIKLQPSTPQLTPISKPSNMAAASTQSAPSRQYTKKFSYEAVTIPFTMGWMRELVHRATTEAKSGKKQSDIYYFTPEGKKLRSMVDISNYLSKQPESKLSLENFTYAKELIYREPFEIERSAKQKSVIVTNAKKGLPKSTSTPKQKFTSTPKQKSSSFTPKITDMFSAADTRPVSTPNSVVPKSTTAKKPNAQKIEKDNSLSESVCKVNDSEKEDSEISLPSRRQIKRRVPFDNSCDERAISKKLKILTRRHSSTMPSSELKTEINNELALLSKPISNTSLIEHTPTPNLSHNKSRGASILKLSQSQKLEQPPPKKAKFKALAPKCIDLSYQSPCSARCMVPRYVAPSIQCHNCLCLFHPQCYPRSARDFMFRCRPCLASIYSAYPNVNISFTIPCINTPVEESIFDIPDDIDATMLSPEVSLQLSCVNDPLLLSTPPSFPPIVNYIPFPSTIAAQEQQTKIVDANTGSPASPLSVYQNTLNTSSPGSPLSVYQNTLSTSSPASPLSVYQNTLNTSSPGSPLSVYQNTLSTSSPASPLSVSQNTTNTSSPASSLLVSQNTTNSAPHLLSHLLQTKVLPKSSSIMPVTSQQVSSITHGSLLPDHLKNSPNTRIYRVRLPVGTGSVALPNQLVIRRLPDRRIMVCSTAPPQLQNKTNIRLTGPLRMPSTGWMPKTESSVVVGSSESRSDAQKQSTNMKVLTAPKNYSKKVKLTDRTTNVPNKNVCQPKSTNVKKNSVVDSKKDKDYNTELINKSVECLTLVFRRLDVYDLLRTTEVSTIWKLLGQQSTLWEKVSFRGLTITNWKRCCVYLQKRGTKFLDLRDIIHPNIFQPWIGLEINVSYLSKIEELIIDHLPPSLLKAIISNMPLLRRFECHFVTTACTEPEIWTTPCEIELAPFRCLGRLVRLKIGSGGGIQLRNGSDYIMPYLPNLRHVALTGFDFHSHVNLEFLSQLNDLISLELGNISSIEPGIYPLLGTLTNLKSLRLENGGTVDEVKFSEALSKMQRLEVLELMNFKISSKLANSLKKLKQIIHVNVWPDTTTESTVINENLFAAMSSMTDLKYLCWGVIAEGDSAPDVLQLRHTDSRGKENDELTFEDLFKKLVDMFSECRVEVKCVPRKLWREFCSTRK